MNVFISRRISQCICLSLLEILVSIGSPAAAAQHPVPGERTLRTLTTVREVHNLGAEDARRGYPVHVQAVITYFDPYNNGIHASLFVHDDTGAIFVLVPAKSGPADQTLHPGTLVDIVGRSSPGDYAALIDQVSIKVIEENHAAIYAKPVNLTQISTGMEDSEFVQVEGIVHSISQSERAVTLNIALADGMIGAVTVKKPGTDYTGLIDANVRLKANVGTLFNANRQIIGSHLLFSGLESLTILDHGSSDVMASPIQSVDSLSRFNSKGNLNHRVHLRGRVTLQWPGSLVCIQDGDNGICAQTTQTTHFQPGELVEVGGYTISGRYKPTLVDAVFRAVGTPVPVAAQRISSEQALEGRFDAEPIQIEGRVLGRELKAKEMTLLLSAGGLVFPVILPANLANSDFGTIRNGSILRVTGICSVLLDTQKMASGYGAAFVQSFEILLRSPQDVVVLDTPSWWTLTHTFLVLGVVLGATSLATVWVVVLRKRVEQQTRVIRESEDRFRHLAQHDPLTGLATRDLLLHRLRLAMNKRRNGQAGIALLMLDLDDFKGVNDLLGHAGGDRTLCETAQRIKAAVRKTDLVARMGGDEFVVLIEAIADQEQAEHIASKIIALFSQPLRVDGLELVVSVSIGVCTMFDGAIEADVLLKNVDTALYEAKTDGRNRFKMFDEEMALATGARRKIREGLVHALSRKELEIDYQPLVASEEGEVIGLEALLRWRSKELGLVMPTEFIPIAEESGLIVPIGEWLVLEACKQIAVLEEQLGRRLTLAVNVSPRQLLHKELHEVVRQALLETGRAARDLTMEITENILMTDSLNMQETLLRIHDLGVQLAIDDFGVGFSGLSYVNRFPVQWIKIDRSFIAKCPTDKSSLAVSRAIIAMAHSLNIRVVAEGVETEEQLSMMRNEKCDAIQGYYFSRPVPPSALLDVITGLDASLRSQRRGLRSYLQSSASESLSLQIFQGSTP